MAHNKYHGLKKYDSLFWNLISSIDSLCFQYKRKMKIVHPFFAHFILLLLWIKSIIKAILMESIKRAERSSIKHKHECFYSANVIQTYSMTESLRLDLSWLGRIGAESTRVIASNENQKMEPIYFANAWPQSLILPHVSFPTNNPHSHKQTHTERGTHVGSGGWVHSTITTTQPKRVAPTIPAPLTPCLLRSFPFPTSRPLPTLPQKKRTY